MLKSTLGAAFIGLVITATAAAGSAAEINAGETHFEIGGSIISKVESFGSLPIKADGESGFKFAITYGIDDKTSIQYRKCKFNSEEKTVTMGTGLPAPYPASVSMTTVATADLNDINLFYKVGDHVKLIFGYEFDKIYFRDYVRSAKRNSFHAGINATYPLGRKVDLVGNLIIGENVRNSEIGLDFAVAKNQNLFLSYIDRRVNGMNVDIDSLNYHTKMDYKMYGLSLMYGIKF